MSSADVLDGLVTSSLESQPSRRNWRSLARTFQEKVSARFTYALADQVVYSFGNMMVAAIVSRRCGLVTFGIYILTQRAIDLLCQLSNAFLWTPYTFNLPDMSGSRRARYGGSTLLFQIFLCLLFSLTLWALNHFAQGARQSIYRDTFTPLVMTSGALLFREFTRRMYFAHLRLREAFWTDVATVLLQIAGVLWFARGEELTLSMTLGALALGAALVSLWWICREWKEWVLDGHETLRDVRLNLRLGRWFLGSNLVYAASSQCNPWILGAFAGGGWVGAYAVCESVVNIPRVAIHSMQNVMAPVLARAHRERGAEGVRTAVRQLDRALIAGSLAMGAIVVILGPWVAHLIFKSVPGNARILLLLLSLNLVAYAGTLAQSYALAALGRADKTFYSSAFGLLVQAIICVFLVHRFQVSGAAASLLLGSLVVFGTRFLFYRKESLSKLCHACESVA